MVQLIWTKLVETVFRVGDLELKWQIGKTKYRALANKHEAMINFYNVDVQYDLKELEAEFFEAVKTLKMLQFIDSEELSTSLKKLTKLF